MVMHHKKQWDFLKSKLKEGQLSHAYLFSGPEEAHAENFTKEFIRFINCLKPNAEQASCQDCQNCKMIEREIFPDLLTIVSKQSESSIKNEKDMMEISVEQIRDAQHFLSYKSYYGGFKIIIMHHAERMSIDAQHCFLKTLEEPKGKTIIFLISSKPDLLLPTIASRCQEIKFLYRGTYEISKDEEKFFRGLESLMGAELAEKFKYVKAANLEEDNLHKILNMLQRYFRKMMLMKIGVIPGDAKNYSLQKLKNIITLIEYMSHQAALTNINNKLALEIVLMEI